MDRSNFCGCKGVRTCIKCEQEFGYDNKNLVKFTEDTYVYCPYCNKAWQGYDIFEYRSHPNHVGKSFPLEGVYIQEDFITEDEAEKVLKDLDELPWDKSQSGRRKQNFGPKCNFKKQKIKLGEFQGFPACTQFIQDRFHKEDVLDKFQTIEQCSLEYDSKNGSSIDNHIDDCWIWGERIVTVNIVGDSVLTLTYYNGDSNKYNLTSPSFCYEKKYQSLSAAAENTTLESNASVLPHLEEMSIPIGKANSEHNPLCNSVKTPSKDSEKVVAVNTKDVSSSNSVKSSNGSDEVSAVNNKEVPSPNSVKTPSTNSEKDVNLEQLSRVAIRIPMPAKSLLVLYGEARYEWQHCVLRSDVIGRRVCIAYREFTTPYIDCEDTREVFEKARRFF